MVFLCTFLIGCAACGEGIIFFPHFSLKHVLLFPFLWEISISYSILFYPSCFCCCDLCHFLVHSLRLSHSASLSFQFAEVLKNLFIVFGCVNWLVIVCWLAIPIIQAFFSRIFPETSGLNIQYLATKMPLTISSATHSCPALPQRQCVLDETFRITTASLF